jgi:hypothetical protein
MGGVGIHGPRRALQNSGQKNQKKTKEKFGFFFNQITERMPHLKYYKAAVFELELPDLDQIKKIYN